MTANQQIYKVIVDILFDTPDLISKVIPILGQREIIDLFTGFNVLFSQKAISGNLTISIKNNLFEHCMSIAPKMNMTFKKKR